METSCVAVGGADHGASHAAEIDETRMIEESCLDHQGRMGRCW